jgi:serine/threonine protein phosphatase 1
MLTYAIGDIHGRHDLLQLLLRTVREHAQDSSYRLVFLGDYIDRGPESAAVLETVRSLQSALAGKVVCLMGNHEDMLLTAMDDPVAVYWWLRNGGDATLGSFGIEAPYEIPGEVLDWLRGLSTSFEDEARYFVHAGLRPGRPFAEQTDEDKLWIREPFLSIDYDFGKHVVHGHTPVMTARPEMRPYRTNLDTGAVFTGVLTAGIFTDEGEKPAGFLSASLGPVEDTLF